MLSPLLSVHPVVYRACDLDFMWWHDLPQFPEHSFVFFRQHCRSCLKRTVLERKGQTIFRQFFLALSMHYCIVCKLIHNFSSTHLTCSVYCQLSRNLVCMRVLQALNTWTGLFKNLLGSILLGHCKLRLIMDLLFVLYTHL